MDSDRKVIQFAHYMKGPSMTPNGENDRTQVFGGSIPVEDHGLHAFETVNDYRARTGKTEMQGVYWSPNAADRHDFDGTSTRQETTAQQGRELQHGSIDAAGRPSYYNQYPTFEVIDVCEQLRAPDGSGNYNRGTAFMYLARAGWKDPAKHVDDLRKAMYYLQREIDRVETGNWGTTDPPNTETKYCDRCQNQMSYDGAVWYCHFSDHHRPRT
jgi:hypothetical protein